MEAPSRPRPSVLPRLDDSNRVYFQSGREGVLRISRCQSCRLWIHPAASICRRCLSRDISDEPLSGRGVVATFTINRQAWEPHLTEPYVVALIELVEQDGLRVLSNVVNCPVESVRIGQPVRVLFEQQEDVWLPLFEPIPNGAVA